MNADTLGSLSASIEDLAAKATVKLFHIPSPLGGRTGLSFDGKRVLVPAFQAEEGEKLQILGPGGAAIEATLLGFDPAQGLAVLGLARDFPEAAWKPAASLPALGALVLVAAYPSPQGPEIRLDAIRFSGGASASASAKETYLQTDGSAFPGFAGAAIVDANDALVGMIAADRGGNRGWAFPVARAAELASSIAAAGFPKRAWLGISTLPVEAPEEYASLFGDGRESALMIAGLAPKGPAAAAGVLVGDILVAVGGKAVVGPGDLVSAIEALKPGAPAVLALVRAKARIDIEVKPDAAPDGSSAQGKDHGHWGRGHSHGPGSHGGQGPWGRFHWGMGRRSRAWEGGPSCCGPES